ncbi:Ig-like domain-containing protein [Streptomyces sp. AC495_CC817]|uniref:EndoS/ChiA family endoglycosidase n=1 Tax=Streptomyces sp. AC495_CC817 TaxID=2823900 RepID=UPI001C2685D5|nr:Ig-like domain-containing protein [Streptomyces sp. AC495_CC817]
MKRTTALALSTLLTGLAAFAAQPAIADTAAAPAAASTADSTVQCESTPQTMAYYRTWRDVTVPQSANSNLPDPNVTRMTDLPAEIDVAMVFDAGATAGTDYWPTLRDTYVPELHARGTKVVYTLWIDRLAKADIPLTQEAYRAYAQELVDTFVTPYGLDGIDIDVESYPQGDDLTRAIGVFNALGELIGPKSGTDRIFIYDTNQTGDTPLFEAVAGNISYVLLQAYGRGTAGMQSTWETFADDIAPCRFLPGFSFYEEQDRTHWGDAEGIYDPATAPSSTAYQYAVWQPEVGTKGGFFAYAVDRDGKVFGDDSITKTDFTWMKNLSRVQDEAAGVTPEPPAAPTAAIDQDRVTLRGTGVAGAEISAVTSGPGHTPAAATATVASDGTWNVTLDRKVTRPQTVAVTQSVEGTASEAVSVRVRPGNS